MYIVLPPHVPVAYITCMVTDWEIEIRLEQCSNFDQVFILMASPSDS